MFVAEGSDWMFLLLWCRERWHLSCRLYFDPAQPIKSLGHILDVQTCVTCQMCGRLGNSEAVQPGSEGPACGGTAAPRITPTGQTLWESNALECWEIILTPPNPSFPYFRLLLLVPPDRDKAALLSAAAQQLLSPGLRYLAQSNYRC